MKKLLLFVFGFILVLFSTKDVFSSNLNLSVTVPAKASDFSIEITKDIDEIVPQYHEIEYFIDYNSSLKYSTPIVLEAEWSQGTVEGSVTPSVEAASYVIGSATKAVNNTPAVIDNVNKKIRWSIPSFRSKVSDQTVSFRLKTTDEYTGPEKVTFTVSARIINGSLIVPDVYTNSSYRYDLSLAPTPTPTPLATPTPTGSTNGSGSDSNTPPTTVITTPTPAVNPNIEEINIVCLNNNKVCIDTKTNIDGQIKVTYGKKLNNLNKSLNSLNITKLSELEIEDLEPETTYYFKVSANTNLGSIGSDIYAFKTPAVSTSPEVVKNSIIVSSEKNILAAPEEEEQISFPEVVVPQETVYEVRFKLKRSESVKNIQAYLRDGKVLGIFYPHKAQASTRITNLSEIEPGVFAGKLKAPSNSGRYELSVRITDVNGNISEQKIANIKVSGKMKIVNKDNVPVEKARIAFYVFDRIEKTFKLISPEIYSLDNPSYSLENGEVDVVLPKGKYKAQVLALGYKEKKLEFTIGNSDNENYPLIVLEKDYFSHIAWIKYIGLTGVDLINLSSDFSNTIAMSSRYFELAAVIVILVLITLSFYALSLYTHVPVTSLPHYFLIQAKIAIPKLSLRKYIVGKVINSETNFPEKGAIVHVIDPTNGKNIAQARTDRLGDFFIKKTDLRKYKIIVVKKGYEELSPYIYEGNELGQVLTIKLKEIEPNLKLKFTESIINNLISMLLSFFIISAFFTEISFAFAQGWLKTLPFIIISTLSLFIWCTFFVRSIKFIKLSDH